MNPPIRTQDRRYLKVVPVPAGVALEEMGGKVPRRITMSKQEAGCLARALERSRCAGTARRERTSPLQVVVEDQDLVSLYEVGLGHYRPPLRMSSQGITALTSQLQSSVEHHCKEKVS